MNKDNYIKVRDEENHESMWAIDLGNGLAKLENTSFSGKYSLYDVVAYQNDGDFNQITKLIERNMISMFIQYIQLEPEEIAELPEDTIKDKFHQVIEHLKPHGILCEGVVAGILVGSIPKEAVVGFDAIMDSCPVECEYAVNE